MLRLLEFVIVFGTKPLQVCTERDVIPSVILIFHWAFSGFLNKVTHSSVQLQFKMLPRLFVICLFLCQASLESVFNDMTMLIAHKQTEFNQHSKSFYPPMIKSILWSTDNHWFSRKNICWFLVYQLYASAILANKIILISLYFILLHSK